MILRETTMRWVTSRPRIRLLMPMAKNFSSNSSQFHPGHTATLKSSGKQEAFFDDSVQKLLKSLTGLDNSKVFRVAKLGQHISAPTYSFLTEEELKEIKEKAREKAMKKLQMPPVMDSRSDETETLEIDQAIQGYDSAKLVFTDITFGVHERDRIIVVRDPDGTLRTADPEQRDRLNQIYFPSEGKKVNTPPMFEPQQLEEILGPKKYLYILDRNCAQFEPDHPVYIRTAHMVYDHVNSNGHFDNIWSTRHYGPMVFYLVWEKKCDDILVHYLQTRNLRSVAETLTLFCKLHPTSTFVQHCPPESYDRDTTIQSLRQFISLESNKSTKLKGALETMLEVEESNRKAAEGLDKVHTS